MASWSMKPVGHSWRMLNVPNDDEPELPLVKPVDPGMLRTDTPKRELNAEGNPVFDENGNRIHYRVLTGHVNLKGVGGLS